MKRLIYLLIFISALCQGQMTKITDYSTKITLSSKLYNWNNSSLMSLKDSMAQWLDGTRVGDSLIDKSGHHYNVAIIGNDITLAKGIPYKSACFIAQNANTFGHIPNPNYFWFTAGGTPNQIPVVSFSNSNIDWGNQILAKNVDGINHPTLGYELREGFVSDIVTFKYPQTTTPVLNLLKKYFSVPTKQVANIREVGTGKTYSTINAALTAASAGDLIYVYSGIYTPAAGYLYVNKAVNITGLGFVQLNTTYALFAFLLDHTTTISGIYLTGSSTYLFSNGTTGIIINRCYYAHGVFWRLPAGDFTLNNCVFTAAACGTDGTPAMTLNGCYLKNTGYTITQNVTFNNCKILHQLAVDNSIFTVNTGSLYLKGCNISTAHRISIHATGNTNDLIQVSYCNISHYYVASQTVDMFYCVTSATKYKLILLNNTFTSAQVAAVSGSFVHVLNTTFDIENNIFINKSTSDFQQVLIVINGSRALTSWIYKNNYHLSESSSGGVVSLGGETHYADIMNGGEFSGNRIVGALSTYPTAVTNIQHGLLLTSGINNKIAYNYISDCEWGFVIKTENQAYTSEGIYYNISANNGVDFDIGGIQGMNIFNNTAYNNNSYEPVHFLCGFEFVVRSALYDCYNEIVKNNIFYTNSGSGDFASFDPRLGAGKGNVLTNNILYGYGYAIIDDLNYATLVAAQAAGWLANCTNANPNIISATQAYPLTPITTNALDLGAPYNVGLDISTNWGDATHYPVIVTKNQGVTWQMGAYVQ